MKPQVGDVIRWDRAWGRDQQPPIWSLLVSEDDDTGGFNDITLIGNDGLRTGEGDFTDDGEYPIDNEHARADIVPADELPDEVLAALAKYQLTGDPT